MPGTRLALKRERGRICHRPRSALPCGSESSAVPPPFFVSAIAGRLQFPLHVASLPKALAQVALAQFLQLSGRERKTPAENSMGQFSPASVRSVVVGQKEGLSNWLYLPLKMLVRSCLARSRNKASSFSLIFIPSKRRANFFSVMKCHLKLLKITVFLLLWVGRGEG